MLDAESRIKALEDKMDNMFRVGVISSIDEFAGTARVAFKARSNLVSYDLPILVRNTLKNKDYWMPDIDEQVLCMFLPIGLEAGFILGGFYSKNVTPPTDSADKPTQTFSDGTRIEYDRKTQKLQIDIPEETGKVVINCAGQVDVNAPKINLGESASLEPSVLGDKLAAAFAALESAINDHTHGNGNNGSPTDGPIDPIDFGDLLSGGNVYSTKNKNQ